MSIAALIRRMAELGAPAEAIALAVEAIENEQAKDAERKQKRAEQKAKERERKATVARLSRDMDATVGDTLSPLDPPSFLPPTPPNQTPPYNPPTPENPPSPTAQTPRGSTARGSRLPDDFRLTPDLLAYAAEKGLTEAQAAECLAEMREWAMANSNRPVARKADWSLTLQGWFRRKAQDLARAGPRNAESRAANFWGSNLAKAAE